jgi:hypothetical protein
MKSMSILVNDIAKLVNDFTGIVPLKKCKCNGGFF